MPELELIDWMTIGLCALLIGLSKSGLPNMIILVVTLIMFVFPARESVGFLLPMLLIGDLFAVTFYRRNVVWKYLISLIPWVSIGIVAGFFVLQNIRDEILKPLIGVIILVMIALNLTRQKFGDNFNKMLPNSLLFIILMGALGGFTSMVGNAAGAIMTIYLLVKGLPKREFIGTGAWFFLTVNLIKAPFYLHLNIITLETFSLNMMMVPIIIVGALIGIRLLKYVPQKVFTVLVLIMATIGGLNLVFD
ncbi:sulfite exporter TauE/SafE family protein [Oceanobacillus sp. J11TS1]|uniref:sulfite exporter TauE/SafE family protein n=1 Tax=Oceanobacillus sp. J11TS1 TaxID=2807191 RepID=UPI001AFCFBBD|nr:sulfite exporter TauE/SafE family protein [Oceanobacillus sp. J11TS1]GIO21524.1 anion permease [Oceanobacillus sp. J11TS1]